MKTVEQASQNAFGRLSVHAEINEADFKVGFKIGVEFAQSWIDADLELPSQLAGSDYSDEVLTKTVDGFFYAEQYDYEDGVWTLSPTYGKVTHWRPI